MDIQELAKSYKTMEELQIYCQSQFRQILNLSKKIKELEDKNTDLTRKVKEGSVVTVAQQKDLSSPITGASLLVKDDAKTIAQVQLKLLKEMSFDRELTLDEAKRVEIFNKIANAQEEKPKTFKADAKTLNTDDLLSLIEKDNEPKRN
jgi:hypothetical protein